MERGTSGTFIPYGPWATLALTGAVLFSAHLCSELAALMMGGAAERLSGDRRMVAPIIGQLVGLAVLVKLTEMRAPTLSAAYLALRGVGRQAVWRWLGIMAGCYVGIWIVSGILRSVLGIPPPPTVLDDAPFGIPLVLTVVVVGPVFEEALFRGFMLRGMLHTPLGQSGAIVLTSLAWTLMHGNYDLIALTSLFFLGIVMGLARVATGSLLLPVLLHVALNLVAVLFWIA